jgi:hypothetical protein
MTKTGKQGSIPALNAAIHQTYPIIYKSSSKAVLLA